MFLSYLTLALATLCLSLIAAAPINGTDLHKRAPVQIVRNCVNSGQVALTFDDGIFQYEDDIARTLGNSKATFFVNGNNWGCIYSDQAKSILRALDQQGHTLGSHGWSHKDMTTLSWDQIHDELWRVEQAFERILGKRPIYFRPPYGKYNDLLLAALENRGYRKMFLWSDDVQDGNGASAASQKGVYDSIANSYPNTHLVLAHSVHTTSAFDVTPYAVDRLRNRGYQLVAVDTCMGSQGEWPYRWIGQPQSGNWWC
ncbi:hypothetical protein QFC20_005734 [Naganishia adeliensis]|uniref:Uncharacterized protein n=1 Tax=Naganishia adeliensis TaxID=92952 RepID=A0ACC2VJT9_9TREE|nr:hypothetical protein QFC20_005734 [Naganishia adeliensis]